ncbi:MAG: PHP domain-containing protein [Owenweeksia sp.]|nr:PHP domain-containing protein [Owenweeksia sp.]
MLNNHSTFSFTYGTLSLEEMLEWARVQGLSELVLTDINNTAAGIEFVRLAGQAGIKPILGIDFRNGNEQRYVVLALNNEGYAEINRFLSAHLMSKTDFPPQAPPFLHAHISLPLFKGSLQDTGRK